jgi:hypothetical protein
MKWFRSNIKHGSRLALFALVVQFALSFGHFHAIAAPASPAIKSVAALSGISTALTLAADTAGDAAQQPSPLSHDPDQQSTDACAICAVMALASAALFSAPPLLPLPEANGFLFRIADAEFVLLNSARVAFQPRAPPIS